MSEKTFFLIFKIIAHIIRYFMIGAIISIMAAIGEILMPQINILNSTFGGAIGLVFLIIMGIIFEISMYPINKAYNTNKKRKNL